MRDWVCDSARLPTCWARCRRRSDGARRWQAGDIADAAARLAAGEFAPLRTSGRTWWSGGAYGQDLTRHPDVLAAWPSCSPAGGARFAGQRRRLPGNGRGIYKSAVLVGAHEVVGSYRKTRLVLFGEYVPLRPLFG